VAGIIIRDSATDTGPEHLAEDQERTQMNPLPEPSDEQERIRRQIMSLYQALVRTSATEYSLGQWLQAVIQRDPD